ncbi:MAG: hypothetical protein LBH25_08360 [Fibromonadaceae bacterium]|jgi:hypothetical protein|nr:hypothetical protein [Fibromonadaceae bacterium]
MRLFSTLILCLFAFSFASNEYLTLGDHYYSKRAEGAKNNNADPKNIKEAIKNYTLALGNQAAREEAAWKLLRAYYFLGCFTMSKNPKDRKIHFEKAKKEGKVFFNEFPKNNEVIYWYSVNLALWAVEVNPFVALNAGSVKESREIAQKLIEAEKRGDKKAAARGYQILGRAHHKVPKIAFVLNWVNRDSAETYLLKAYMLDKGDLVNSLFLAEYYKDQKDTSMAKATLLPFLKNKPRPEEFLEDERNFIKMRKLLE